MTVSFVTTNFQFSILSFEHLVWNVRVLFNTRLWRLLFCSMNFMGFAVTFKSVTHGELNSASAVR
jgi:hypothetical protein